MLADAMPDLDHRHRLLQAMAETVSAKGYAAVTIADLAAAARVSKRSFYEHFSDKPACFIALYESASLATLKVLRDAIDPRRDWHDQVEQALSAYLACLARNPALLATLFIEIMALGPEGLAARRRTSERFADLITEVVKNSGQHDLGREQAVAIVGGIHEWVLQAIETQRVPDLPQLAGPGARLVRAVLDARS